MMSLAHAEATPANGKVDRTAFPYRMKDLCERTGLLRQVIHFYIQQGLVPEGYKTGRNMAYYGEQHLERILLVRRLQHERFLPLRAIKALLDEQDEAFSPAQRQFVNELKSRLSQSLGARMTRPATVQVDELVEKLGVRARDVDDFIEIGLVGATEERGRDGRVRRVIARDDVWILETFAELRTLGFTEEIGFCARDIGMYAEAMSNLLAREAKLLAERLSQLPADAAAKMVERAAPIIHSFLARYHDALMKNYLATL
jgi:DNA-binding transcriptional MerR regulator